MSDLDILADPLPAEGVVLCADDYGIAPGVGTAIRALVASNRISAVSCMSIAPHWPAEAELLKPLAGAVAVGLHLTLTDFEPLGPMPLLAPKGRLPGLYRLLYTALMGTLGRTEIEAEIARQIGAFVMAMGAMPAFIDGHQHVHLLPVIRNVVFDRLPPGSWVRYCDESFAAISRRGVAPFKAEVISLLGRKFGEIGRARGIPGNTGFTGVHDFSGRRPYAELLGHFLDGAQPGLLVMCHPGFADEELHDPVTTPRHDEYEALAGSELPRLLHENGIALSKAP